LSKGERELKDDVYRVTFENVSIPVDVQVEDALTAGKCAFDFLQSRGYTSSVKIIKIELIAEPIDFEQKTNDIEGKEDTKN
jgi:hypothetical protein